MVDKIKHNGREYVSVQDYNVMRNAFISCLNSRINTRKLIHDVEGQQIDSLNNYKDSIIDGSAFTEQAFAEAEQRY